MLPVMAKDSHYLLKLKCQKLWDNELGDLDGESPFREEEASLPVSGPHQAS